MRVKHYAWTTQQCYSGWIARYIEWLEMGHAQLSTTQGYYHAEPGRVVSPLV